MSEHVCEKKTKSALLSESSCSVLSEISGSETKQHSFHTELSPWQQIFLDWGNKGLCSMEVRQCWLGSAWGCGPAPCTAPQEQLMGVVRGSAYPCLKGCQHQPAQHCGVIEASMAGPPGRQCSGSQYTGSRSRSSEVLKLIFLQVP